MRFNDVIQPLPILDRISDQIHRQPWHLARDFELISPTNRFLPFQIKRDNDFYDIERVILWDVNDNAIDPLFIDNIPPSDLQSKAYLDGDRLMYLGQSDFLIPINPGEYYLEIVSNNVSYFTEVFKAVNQSTVLDQEYQKVCFKSCVQTNLASFDCGFSYYFYLDTELAVPDYEIDENSQINEKRERTFTYQKFTKFYAMDMIVPEYMSDVINSLDLHDEIELKLCNGDSVSIKEWSVETNNFDPTSGYNGISVRMIVDCHFRSMSCETDNELPINPALNHVDVVSTIIANEEEFYLGGYYCDGQFIEFATNDPILIFDDETQETGSIYRYTSQGLYGWAQYANPNDVVNPILARNTCTDQWFIWDAFEPLRWHTRPTITSVEALPNGNYRIKGLSFPNTLVHVYYSNGGPLTAITDLTDGVGEVLDQVYSLEGVEAIGTFDPDTVFWVRAFGLGVDYGYSDPFY